ncbi:gamma-glutamylcyclotransferase [Plutella xylostella]|uniref:gamma-glutamylcyclotransferase n=1 Tax=Plutella xylostella TaxID=51655 RepID=UPI0005D0E1E0|nr:gamma-glutamylcyclotransferase [Plutella xylostella]
MVNVPPDHFLYFAYGSNLLKKRIHINNPSAEFIGIGRLDHYQVNFIKYGPRWKGCSATIVPTDNRCLCKTCKCVWGTVWMLHNNDMPALDEQEGVSTNWYFPKTVKIETEEGKILECRTYQQSVNPPATCDHTSIPPDRRPSETYLKCIVLGAIECKLPKEYIQLLKLIPHNGEISHEMENALFSKDNINDILL